MKEFTYIYALRDPGTNEIKYVGKSNNPESRAKNHYSEGVNARKMLWMKDLKERGLRPELIILEQRPIDDFRQAESSWIHFFLDLGCNLVNAIYPGYDRLKMMRAAYAPAEYA